LSRSAFQELAMRKRPFLAALLLLPTIASAQRRGSGSFGRDEGANYGGPGAIPGLQLSNGDVEDMSPIKLLIDKRKDLKLSDERLKELKDLENKLKEKVKPSFKALDSLRREMRPGASDEARSRSAAARGSVMPVVTTIRESYDEAYKEALPLLDESQQKMANDLVQKQKTESDETLKAKLEGRGGGRRG